MDFSGNSPSYSVGAGWAGECHSRCEQNSECKGYTFKLDGHQCWLEDSVDGKMLSCSDGFASGTCDYR